MCRIIRLRNASVAMRFEMLRRSSLQPLGNVSHCKAVERITSDAFWDLSMIPSGTLLERVALQSPGVDHLQARRIFDLEAHCWLRVPRDISGLLSARRKRVAQPTKACISHRLVQIVFTFLLCRDGLLCIVSGKIHQQCHKPKLQMIGMPCRSSRCIDG